VIRDFAKPHRCPGEQLLAVLWPQTSTGAGTRSHEADDLVSALHQGLDRRDPNRSGRAENDDPLGI
jgi:hypothetical protein